MIIILNYIRVMDEMQYLKKQFTSLIYYPGICRAQLILNELGGVSEERKFITPGQ